MTPYITQDYLLPLSLAAVSLIISLIVTFTYRRRVSQVARAVKESDSEPLPASGYPDVSIIVYTHNNASGVAELLPTLLSQDYPGEFEIIVVNDGRDDATEALMNGLGDGRHRVYHTFTPHDTRNLSRKKLALTLGIKAARHEAIVHLTSESRVNSDEWLRHMALPLADASTGLVIGYAAPDNDTARGCRLRDHDRLADSVHYLASALRGKTYRGNGDNLGYRRSTFFDLKGFSNSLNLHYGDDDIFVADAAAMTGTAVAIATAAQVSTEPDDPATTYRYSKLRHAFTAKFAGSGQHAYYAAVSAMMWLWVAVTAAAVALAPLNPVSDAAAGLSAIILWVPLMVSWRRASAALHSRRLMLSAPIFLLGRPIRNFLYLLRSKKIHDAQYSWQSTS